ncbi:MAG: DNA-protecting protein DprA [Zoogloeaceae bacterium]|nr:DNA-protecting protein DprA [Zoogloeaceae bacterium]
MPTNGLDAAWLRLTLIPGIGGETQRKLLAALGLPEQIFAASFSTLRSIVGDKAARLLLETDNQENISKALDWGTQAGQHILTLADEAYPQALLEIPDPPSVLYVRGQAELLNTPAIAIVGSRNATPQGESNARAFATALAGSGLCIVSGLALGIDAAAHQGALAADGATIAVIGTGADRLYPARNQSLACQIAANGAIVSEFPLGTPAAAANFPRRNRLISGLSRGVLVVEAAVESGSLITARLAGEQGREVFAIPGSIHSPQARGCHRLIRQGAKLVETAQDILEELNVPVNSKSQKHSNTGHKHSDDTLLQFAGFDPVTVDQLVARSGLTAEAVSVMLLQLELDGQIASLPGGRFQRLTETQTTT